jgi:hypothetical protein
MHTCPFCDFLCDCDCDDTWGLPMPDDCSHMNICPEITGEDEFESDWEEYEEFMDFEEE